MCPLPVILGQGVGGREWIILLDEHRQKITGGGISMHKDVEVKRQDLSLRNGLKSNLLGVSAGGQDWVHVVALNAI